MSWRCPARLRASAYGRSYTHGRSLGRQAIYECQMADSGNERFSVVERVGSAGALAEALEGGGHGVAFDTVAIGRVDDIPKASHGLLQADAAKERGVDG